MNQKTLVESIYESDEASPGLLFWRAFYNWQRQIRMALDPLDVTQVQYAIMAALSYLASDNMPVIQQDIAETLGTDKMMVSDVIKTLVKKTFILRRGHPRDARAYALSLTALGTKKLKACVPLVEGVDERFFRSTGKYYPHFFESIKILSKR